MKTPWKALLLDTGAEFNGDELCHYGNPDQESRLLAAGAILCDLSHLGLIGVHGADARNFLQAQLANDMRQVDAKRSPLGCYLSPKGRVLANFRIVAAGPSFYLQLPQDNIEEMIAQLRRFILRAQVSVEDDSYAFIRFGLAGPHATRLLESLWGSAPAASNQTQVQQEIRVIRTHGVHPRYEFWGDLPAMSHLWNQLLAHAAPVGPASWALLDILSGLGYVQLPTRDMFLPQMLNLDVLDGIGFQKGCYPGQEIVTRTRSRGTLKRRLYVCRIDRNTPLAPGSSVYAGDNEGQAIGHVLQAQPHPDGGLAALAVLQIEAIGGAMRVEGAPLRLCEQPYPIPA